MKKEKSQNTCIYCGSKTTSGICSECRKKLKLVKRIIEWGEKTKMNDMIEDYERQIKQLENQITGLTPEK